MAVRILLKERVTLPPFTIFPAPPPIGFNTAPMTWHYLLDKLFRKHNRELLAFAARQASPHSAEDIAQEAFLRLMNHPDLAAIDNPRAYLFKTAANLSRNLYDYDQVRQRYHSEQPVDAESLPSSAPSLDTAIAAQQQLERFLAVLGQLPEVCQHAFVLNKFDGLSYAEVAEALGISAKSAQRYVLKAWQHVLQNLGEEFFGDGTSG